MLISKIGLCLIPACELFTLVPVAFLYEKLIRDQFGASLDNGKFDKDQFERLQRPETKTNKIVID